MKIGSWRWVTTDTYRKAWINAVSGDMLAIGVKLVGKLKQYTLYRIPQKGEAVQLGYSGSSFILDNPLAEATKLMRQFPKGFF